ncbi:MAG TPA: hypothetical protein VK807_05605 [Gemmatimonadaceae bacterium]|jgi:predicted phage tail protein|nr:hypothetical protein [Gemmatimonadaceae bacterium]
MRTLFRLALLLTLAFVPRLAYAQAGPTVEAARSGIPAHVATEDLSPQEAADRAARGAGLGTGGALMIIGGAAFITGLIIGGGAGTALAVGGVLVAAYGLYIFLK